MHVILLRVRILLTNDDGHDAPGLVALENAARTLGEVVVAAPAVEWSGCGHRVTTKDVVRVEPAGTDRFIVHGTPADCVRLALDRLAPDVDLVLAGVNQGGNLGVDVFYSGTVAAAREAGFHGKPAIAISHYLARGRAIDWQRTADWVARALKELLALPEARSLVRNVNLPHLDPGADYPGLVFAPIDPSPLPIRFEEEGEGFRYRGDYHGRETRPGHDVAVCFGGRIAVSPL
jgi:5'-nucleotidase